MSRAAAALPNPYRVSLFGAPDPRSRRGLQVAGVVGLVVLAAVYLVPVRQAEMMTVDDVPERFAKLILEEPEVKAPPVALPKPPEVVIETPKVEPKPEVKPEEPAPAPKPATRREKPKLAENQGKVGRERAKQEVAALNEVKESLDKVLADVSASLESTNDGKADRKPARRRRARSGRSGTEVASAKPDAPAVAVASTAIAGAGIQIEALAEAGLPAPKAKRADGTTAKRGEIRSDAELMAVVRKYAPGIQFCYDNELKKSPGLGGKLIVSITVAASGKVTDATVVTDTVRSAAMVGCALAQIQAWKFPKVTDGTVTFQAPFVFTPPE